MPKKKKSLNKSIPNSNKEESNGKHCHNKKSSIALKKIPIKHSV